MNNNNDTCRVLQACPAFQLLLALDDDDNDDANQADDATWVLTSSFVILTMQSGFGLLEIGYSSAGHEINTMLKNVYDVVFGALAYYSLGYAISFGTPSNAFMGTGDFFLTSESRDVSFMLPRYLFQFSFAATSTTIVSGCIAMRMKFKVYCAYAFYAVIVYAFCAHWVFADTGWLRQLGMYDFAGGGPVHLLGGVNGAVAILMVGPRSGRFDGSRPVTDFEPSSPTNILFGLFMLWWGWIGFNCGSTLGITNQKWLVATRAAATTINSTAGGGIAALLYSEIRSRGELISAPDVSSGILASLVAITPACACVNPHEALLIGFIAGGLAIGVNDFIKSSWCRLDDPVGAIGVHTAAAIWGLIAVGLFADSSLPGIDVMDGLFRGGGWKLLGLQLLGIVAIVSWGVALVTPFFYLVGVLLGGDWRNPRMGLRVPEESELEGIDRSIHRSMRLIAGLDKEDTTIPNDDSTNPHQSSSTNERPSLATASGYNHQPVARRKKQDIDVDTNAEPTDEATEFPEEFAMTWNEEEKASDV